MNDDQKVYHIEAWKFTSWLRQQDVRDWNFERIRDVITHLEKQHGAAYPTP